MSMTALPKLEELISDLDRQEEEVANQLEAVRAKLEAVRAVLPLFDESVDAVVTAPTTKTTKKTTTKASTAKTATKAATASPAEKAPKQPTKGKTKKKKDGRAASWQKYTRPGVKNQSIPDAVKLILSTQPDKEFKIAEVMAALFKDNMPKAQYLKARNRVSNVLSGGVRAGDWHRGGRSTYRMSAS
ncbi:MAG: hypothetical protein AB8B99_03960 [Phormidesmis sp.]